MFQVLFVVILFAWSLESVCQVTVYYDLFLFCSSLFYLSGYLSLELFVQVLFSTFVFACTVCLDTVWHSLSERFVLGIPRYLGIVC